MAQNENYSQVDLRVGTEAQFNAKVDTLPAGTLFGITDATVSKADLSTDLKNEINSKLNKPTTPSVESAVTLLSDGTVGTKPLSEIGGGTPTAQTKYQHNLVLEGTNLVGTFKAFMSIPRSDNTTFGALDEVVAALGDAYIPCTGYIYDGNQKSFVIVAFNTDDPGFEFNDPETGGQVFAIGNDDVVITDNVIEF